MPVNLKENRGRKLTELFRERVTSAINTQKAVDLEERPKRVRQAFYEQFIDFDVWVVSIFDTHVVVEESWEVYFEVKYEEGQDGIIFEERLTWTPVEKRVEFVPVRSYQHLLEKLASASGIQAKSIDSIIRLGELPDTAAVKAVATALGISQQKVFSALREDRAARAKSDFRRDGLIARCPKAVKMVGDGVFEGYLMLWGDATKTDLAGDYFTKETEIGLEDGDTVSLFYDHGFNPHTKTRKIGMATVQKDDQGLFLRGEIAKSEQYRADIEYLIEEGRMAMSSGALPWLVDGEQHGKSFYWKQWIVGEASLTVTPAEPRILVQSAKSFGGSGLTFRSLSGRDDDEALNKEPVHLPEPSKEPTQKKKTMEPEQFKTLADGLFDRFEGLVDGMKADKATQEEAYKAKIDALEAKVDEMQANSTKMFDAPALHTSGIKHYKYDHLSPGEIALAATCLKAASDANLQGAKNIDNDALASLAMRLMGDDGKKAIHSRNAFLKMAHSRNLSLKANELHQSDLATAADEWVGVAYSSELWDEVHLAPTVFNRLRQIEMPQGAESMQIGTKDGSVTFYTVAQAASQAANPGDTTKTVKTSKITSGSKSLTMAKLGAAASYTGELNEDSFLPFVGILRADMLDEMLRVLDHVVIDGDTATGATTNINDIAGTPNGDEAFLAFNGFRKLALVTNTANSRDGGTITEEDVLETFKLMGTAGEDAADPTACSLIVDLPTYWKMLELAKVNTKDVNTQAVIERGVLSNIYGYEIIRAAYMHRANANATYGRKTNANGKIDLDTASNNTKGAMLGVRWDQWLVGWKRRFTIEAERVPRADTTEFTGLLRLGMVNRSNEASAISYNLTV